MAHELKRHEADVIRSIPNEGIWLPDTEVPIVASQIRETVGSVKDALEALTQRGFLEATPHGVRLTTTGRKVASALKRTELADTASSESERVVIARPIIRGGSEMNSTVVDNAIDEEIDRLRGSAST
jgi:hypothetical protein